MSKTDKDTDKGTFVNLSLFEFTNLMDPSYEIKDPDIIYDNDVNAYYFIFRNGRSRIQVYLPGPLPKEKK